MNIKDQIVQKLKEVVKELTNKDISSRGRLASGQKIHLSIPSDDSHGDYSANIALRLAKTLGKSPLEIAERISKDLRFKIQDLGLEKVEAVAPGFINFYLSKDVLLENANEVIKNPEKVAGVKQIKKNIMVEFAHPNTHKELHIGHMRTLTTGESLARIFEATGAKVFRANYQGDIGPHVAKAIYGVKIMMREQDLTIDEINWTSSQKAHFLGQGYARGSKDYENEAVKKEIDTINTSLYKKEKTYWDIYERTRKWSLDYYDEFYKRFYTKFDHLFFESQVYESGKKIINQHIGDVFQKDKDGSVILPGEKYGLHTRVFITSAGNATYEGKEIGLGFMEYDSFHFDMKIHVVASEQTGYFQVVFKALELIDPKKFEGHEYHLPMGMVSLVGKKMSSRTGDVLTVDELLDKVKLEAVTQFKEDKLDKKEKEEVLEKVTIGAVKYSVLKGGVTQNALFDIEKSVSLQGNSGPYVQYTYARTQSILTKSGTQIPRYKSQDTNINTDELKILRIIQKFPDMVEMGAATYSPNVIAEYLFNLCQLFNKFYQKYRILNANTEKEKNFRLALTATTGIVIKQGLSLLGIQATGKM